MTKRAPQRQSKSIAQVADTVNYNIVASLEKDQLWQVNVQAMQEVDKENAARSAWYDQEFTRKVYQRVYVLSKKRNDDLEDERLRLATKLQTLPPEKEMLKLRRRLIKLDKLKQEAHKEMSDAWQRICGYGVSSI